jgi:hypothetical protein
MSVYVTITVTCYDTDTAERVRSAHFPKMDDLLRMPGVLGCSIQVQQPTKENDK